MGTAIPMTTTAVPFYYNCRCVYGHCNSHDDNGRAHIRISDVTATGWQWTITMCSDSKQHRCNKPAVQACQVMMASINRRMYADSEHKQQSSTGQRSKHISVKKAKDSASCRLAATHL